MGLGLFATRDIPRGTLVLSEEPLFVIPAHKLDTKPATREKVQSFCKSMIKQGVYSDKQAPLLELVSHDDVEADEEVVGACLDFVTSLARRLSLGRDAIAANAALFARLYSVFHYNLLAESSVVRPTDEYLCPTFARLNHSCSPNCHPQINNVTKKLNVHAVKDVRAGEQLFIPYIESAGVLRYKRDELLFCRYLVDCNCAMCSDASSTDNLQRELYQMYQGSFYFVSPELRETDKVSMEVRVPSDRNEAIKFCHRALELILHPSIDLHGDKLRAM